MACLCVQIMPVFQKTSLTVGIWEWGMWDLLCHGTGLHSEIPAGDASSKCGSEQAPPDCYFWVLSMRSMHPKFLLTSSTLLVGVCLQDHSWSIYIYARTSFPPDVQRGRIQILANTWNKQANIARAPKEQPFFTVSSAYQLQEVF